MNDLNKNCLQKFSCSSPCEILHSIALEEAALSHILNAEGEKIQRAVAMEGISVENLLCINHSVAKTIREVTSLELVLLSKLEAACSYCCHPIPTPINHNGWICICVKNCKTHEGLSGAKITICHKNELVSVGCTDCNGQYMSDCLPFGCYLVKIEYQDHPAKICEVIINEHCCNDLKICFDICPPCPPVVISKQIYIKGQVTNKCGRPVANACVIAKGLNCLEVFTDNCGYYEICQLIVADCFSVTPKCGFCIGQSCVIHCVTQNCYCINLSIPCTCLGLNDGWRC